MCTFAHLMIEPSSFFLGLSAVAMLIRMLLAHELWTNLTYRCMYACTFVVCTLVHFVGFLVYAWNPLSHCIHLSCNPMHSSVVGLNNTICLIQVQDMKEAGGEVVGEAMLEVGGGWVAVVGAIKARNGNGSWVFGYACFEGFIIGITF